MLRPLVAAALAAGALIASSPADAACAGTQQLLYVCAPGPTVTPDPITQCVYLLSDTCDDVTVPFYSVGLDGELDCGGALWAYLYPDYLARLC